MGVYIEGTNVVVEQTFTIDGIVIDPTVVTFRVRDPYGDLRSYVYGVDPEVTRLGEGVYELSLGACSIVGDWHYRIEGTGAVEAIGEGEFTIVASNVLSPTGDVLQVGPCDAWCDADDVAQCGGLISEVGSDTFLFETAAQVATGVLHMLSGQQFSGNCGPISVRPCQPSCGCWGENWHSWGQEPAGWSDSRACWECGARSGGCQPVSELPLIWPVREVIEVLIDGQPVDPSTYRIDDSRRLVRTGGLVWPSCQALGLASTEPGTFEVTYRYGLDPPPAGRMAAAQLAGEVWKACNSGECDLPSGTVRMTRQGITIDRKLLMAFVEGKATGLPLVDMFLGAYNPHGLRRPPAVRSPDVKRPVRTGAPTGT